jgi:hypothetical protein
VLLNADWGFFAPLHLCVIFALKKISLAEVLGYTPLRNIFIGLFLYFSQPRKDGIKKGLYNRSRTSLFKASLSINY